MIPDDVKQIVKTRYDKFAETGGNKDSCWPSKQQEAFWQKIFKNRLREFNAIMEAN